MYVYMTLNAQSSCLGRVSAVNLGPVDFRCKQQYKYQPQCFTRKKITIKKQRILHTPTNHSSSVILIYYFVLFCQSLSCKPSVIS